MPNQQRVALWKQLAIPAVAVMIFAAMAASLSKHGGPMVRAASMLEPVALGLALGLCLIYRAINAMGWGLILGSLGEPVGAVPAARVWLASEACRWLPGSLWSFGSRAVLASRRGLPGPTVAASLVLELAVTLAAWASIAALGGLSLRLPKAFGHSIPTPPGFMILLVVAVASLVSILVARTAWFRRRLRGVLVALKDLATNRPDGSRLFGAYCFYVLMAVFNGIAFYAIVRSTPSGDACPFQAVIAANAASWLVGFFAIFAPGGLVVREACLTAALSAWIPADQALAVALVWRLIQILSEIVCFAVVAAWGLPASLSAIPNRQITAMSRRHAATGIPLA